MNTTFTITIVHQPPNPPMFIPGGEVSPMLGLQLCQFGQMHYQELVIQERTAHRSQEEQGNKDTTEEKDPVRGSGVPEPPTTVEQGQASRVQREDTIPNQEE